MATTWIKPIHAGNSIAAKLKLRTEYAKDYDKTESGEYIAAFECDERTADADFLLSKRLYEQKTGRDQVKNDVIAYHIRQSFKPGEVTAQQALDIGYDLARRWTKSKHQFIVAAHTNTNSPHTHIIFNSTRLDHTKKFRNFKWSSIALRRLSDQICLEKGLSIVEKPKPSKGWNHREYLGEKKPPSNREKLEQLIDAALQNAKDYDEFITVMIAAGCEIKRNKNLAFKIPGAERFVRCKSLGEDYTEEAIRERLMGTRKVAPRQPDADPVTIFEPFVITGQTKFGLLLDIQTKIQEGKGEAYVQWAKVYNLKQAAKTLIYLKDKGIDSYDDLVRKSVAASSDFNGRINRIKEIEARQKEISELQKQIGIYSKTRDVYSQYIKSKKNEDFFEANRADITLHKAAKNYFDSVGYEKNKSLPTIASLKQEWATLEAEKKSLYNGYRELKDRRTELLTAKDNCERLLGINRNAPEHTAERKQKSHER